MYAMPGNMERASFEPVSDWFKLLPTLLQSVR